MNSEDDLLKEVEAAVERLAAVLERIQQSARCANERFKAEICTIVGAATAHGLLDTESSAEGLERVFDLWLDCHSDAFSARYGPEWRERLAESAERTYGPKWKSAIVAGKDNNVRANDPE